VDGVCVSNPKAYCSTFISIFLNVDMGFASVLSFALCQAASQETNHLREASADEAPNLSQSFHPQNARGILTAHRVYGLCWDPDL
jgi:hypothetical protein